MHHAIYHTEVVVSDALCEFFMVEVAVVMARSALSLRILLRTVLSAHQFVIQPMVLF